VVLVVGSPSSSNSNRLRELAERCGCDAYLIDGAQDIQKHWFNKASAVGVTAGASAPEILVSGVIDQLVTMGAKPPKELDGVKETISFSLPRELRS
jgi:4-hydroxy-3-methylbut-2-enyl diphosphate reductase